MSVCSNRNRIGVLTGQKTFGIVFEEHVALVGAGTVAVNLGVGRFYPGQPVFGCYVGMFGLLRIVGVIRLSGSSGSSCPTPAG